MMGWAIFKREINWSRPNSVYSFNAKASPEPQERPQDFIDYAVEKGWAETVPAPSREEKRALRAKRGE